MFQHYVHVNIDHDVHPFLVPIHIDYLNNLLYVLIYEHGYSKKGSMKKRKFQN